MPAQRLQKLIAAAGISSRRHAEELITAGNVTFEARAVSDTNGEIKFYLDLRADLGGVASSVNQLADLGGQTEEINLAE